MSFQYLVLMSTQINKYLTKNHTRQEVWTKYSLMDIEKPQALHYRSTENLTLRKKYIISLLNRSIYRQNTKKYKRTQIF